MNKCRYCGKEIPELGRNGQPMKYCSDKCNASYQWFYSGNKTLGHDTCGFAENHKRQISRRRREVYARMQQFAALDGNRH